MRCIKCKRSVKLLDMKHIGHVCKSCLALMVEKRVRKEFRINKTIKKHDRILIVDDGSIDSLVGDHILRSIISGLPVTIFTRKITFSRMGLDDFLRSAKLNEAVDSLKITRVIIPWNIEDECAYFLKGVFEAKPAVHIGEDSFFVKMLINISSAEVSVFAKAKGLMLPKEKAKKGKVAKKKPKKDYIYLMLDHLESMYPETKWSLRKSIKEIKSLT